MNKIFVIEGNDGSGKETQAKELIKNLENLNFKTFMKSFPNYQELSSGPVREYLNGNISKNPNDVSAKATSYFYAVDRYITFRKYIESYYNDNKTIIVFDRYTQSNLIHQGGKLITKYGNTEHLDKFSDWLYNLEYNDLELPSPTATFYLYVPTEFSIELMKNRVNKIDNSSEKDINEKDVSFLYNSSKSGLYYAKKQGWHVIECVKNNKLRSIEDIANEILNIVVGYLK